MDIRIWLWVDSEVKLLEHRYCTLEFIGTVGLEASKHANVFLRVCAKTIHRQIVVQLYGSNVVMDLAEERAMAPAHIDIPRTAHTRTDMRRDTGESGAPGSGAGSGRANVKRATTSHNDTLQVSTAEEASFFREGSFACI